MDIHGKIINACNQSFCNCNDCRESDFDETRYKMMIVRIFKEYDIEKFKIEIALDNTHGKKQNRFAVSWISENGDLELVMV